MRYPAKRRIYLVMDNLSTYWTTAIRDWAADSNVELVPTWDTLAKAMAGYISLRNRTHGGGPIAQLEARRRVA
jgi:hypothetical protein